MFGKRKNANENLATKDESPDLVVKKETIGMPGFTADPEPAPVAVPKIAPAPVPVPVSAPASAPEPEPINEQYQIVEVGMSTAEGIYVYKIVTNKYLGELGGVYEA